MLRFFYNFTNMTTISEMINRVDRLRLREQVPVIIEQTSREIILLNQAQLYERSIDGDGKRLKAYSSPIYAIDKNRMNPLPGLFHPDLKLTGSFFYGMYVKVDKNVFTISSSDEKTAKLEGEYGTAILKLTDESKTRYAKGVFYQGLQRYITGVTGLKFG